mgnify:FL=1
MKKKVNYIKLKNLKKGDCFRTLVTKMKGVVLEIGNMSAKVLFYEVPDIKHYDENEIMRYQRYWLGRKEISSGTEVQKIRSKKYGKDVGNRTHFKNKQRRNKRT